jgi:hypothetical protein
MEAPVRCKVFRSADFDLDAREIPNDIFKAGWRKTTVENAVT